MKKFYVRKDGSILHSVHGMLRPDQRVDEILTHVEIAELAKDGRVYCPADMPKQLDPDGEEIVPNEAENFDSENGTKRRDGTALPVSGQQGQPKPGGEQIRKPNPGSKWNVDPKKIEKTNLKDLNLMIGELDAAQTPFSDPSEARAWLSQDFPAK